MIIPVLPQLHSRNQWIAFCRRETPYCYIEQPQCLVDMQTTYLQLTLFEAGKQGREATKYSLGSRVSVEPVWKLIKSCEWQLDRIIEGLEKMDFSSNVRDNSLLQAHTDVTVRKFFSKERSLIAPGTLGILTPITDEPDIWTGPALMRILANHQYRQYRSGNHAGALNNASSLLLEMVTQPQHWMGQRQDGKLHLYYRASREGQLQHMASLLPDFRPPSPRLLPRRSPLSRQQGAAYAGSGT